VLASAGAGDGQLGAVDGVGRGAWASVSAMVRSSCQIAPFRSVRVLTRLEGEM
jgi:hypothetical protein